MIDLGFLEQIDKKAILQMPMNVTKKNKKKRWRAKVPNDIVNDFDGVLDEFDRIIGKDRIKVLTSTIPKMNGAPTRTATKTSVSAISVSML